MTLKEALAQLEALGNERTRKQNSKNGAGDNQYGVKLGDIRKVAKAAKTDHPLAIKLWATGNVDARFMAILVMEPEELTVKDIDTMIREADFKYVADWFINYVIRKHAEKEALRQDWMSTDHPMAARAGWALTASRVVKEPEGLDLPALLDRIESEMADTDPLIQWTMNACLAEIGIHAAKLRKRALAIGEKLGIYRDYPVSKGCTSPFAPIWIDAMVDRQ